MKLTDKELIEAQLDQITGLEVKIDDLEDHKRNLIDSKARLILTIRRVKQYFEKTKIEGHEVCDMPCLGCTHEWICQDQMIRLVHGALKAEDK
jgi:hypothetical protein